MKQEHLSSPPFLMGHVARSLVSCVMFLDHCLSFLAIVFSVLRCTDSDYPLGIFKLFFRHPKLDQVVCQIRI